MKATLQVSFIAEGAVNGFARFALDLDFTPSLDIAFEHPVWDEGRKPVSISYNTEEGSFFVFMGNDLVNPERLDDHAEMYRTAGWSLA